jgi:hypothetical protein
MQQDIGVGMSRQSLIEGDFDSAESQWTAGLQTVPVMAYSNSMIFGHAVPSPFPARSL